MQETGHAGDGTDSRESEAIPTVSKGKRAASAGGGGPGGENEPVTLLW